MIKYVIFDVDGVVLKNRKKFSQRLSEEYGVAYEKSILSFFQNEFQLCLTGKSDLREELKKYLSEWKWKGTVDELLEYWFSAEAELDKNLILKIEELKRSGIICFLATNNEKYRTKYLISKLRLFDIFENIFSSAFLGTSKNSILFWEEIYSNIGNPPKTEVLVWDDDEENIKAAKEFGFLAEFYSGLEKFEEKMREITGKAL